MTRPTGRTLLITGGFAGVLLVGLVTMRDDDQASTTVAPSNVTSAPTAPQRDVPVVDVRLELLKGPRATLGDGERNPFRFQPRPQPPAPRSSAPPPPRPAPLVPPMPAGPPPPPPIPLRFIGLVDAPTQGGRVAILSDGRGNVFYGREGDIIEGRYKVLRIGAEAAEVSYSDGRGRQTIRLSGQ